MIAAQGTDCHGDHRSDDLPLPHPGEAGWRRHGRPYRIAVTYTGLEDKEQAFEWLERTLEERTLRADFMKVDPWFDNLRGDRRVAILMRRAGLEP